MQIFRVSEDHKTSAQFLDNRRLSKQVLELYQIIRVCLGQKGIIETDTSYLKHPVVKNVYNHGDAYIYDAVNLLKEMDKEHQRRGGKRSSEFRSDLEILYNIVDDKNHQGMFNSDKLPPFYVFGEERCYSQEAYRKYEALLFEKWKNDKIPPRCGVKI